MKKVTINTGGFYMWFGNKPKLSKITVGTAEDGFHYTILINEFDRVVNIHKTIDNPSGKKYEQLFEMSFFTFYRFAVLFNKIELDLIKKYWLSNRINIGKLGRHKLILIPFVEDEGTAGHFVNQKRKKKISFKKEIPIDALMDLPKFPDEIYDSKQTVYWVVSTKRGKNKSQGLIFKHPQDPRNQSFFFVSRKNFSKYNQESATALFNILKQLNFKHKESILQYMNVSVGKTHLKEKIA